MLKKIYQELVEIKEELQATRMNKRTLTIDNLNTVRKSYGRTTVEWRRFELLTESEVERERLERILKRHNLSRQDLAVILFGLRVRPEFGKEHFGI